MNASQESAAADCRAGGDAIDDHDGRSACRDCKACVIGEVLRAAINDYPYKAGGLMSSKRLVRATLRRLRQT